MFAIFPRFDFDEALEMSRRTYELNREFRSQVPKLREARDAMLLEWRGPYGDFLYRHCLEGDIENHSNIKQIEDWGYAWIQLWKQMVNTTNSISFGQAESQQGRWDYWYGRSYYNEWGPEWYPPIETRVVDGRFLEAPQWRRANWVHAPVAPNPPGSPRIARPPVRFAAVEPPFVYYELIRDNWNLVYSYQVPIQRDYIKGRGPRPKEVLPLRPWTLPGEQGSSPENSINLALVREYLQTSSKILVSLRKSVRTLEEQWRNFERDNETPNNDSSWLKYVHRAISEMWRTRQFVKKVKAELDAGADLGTFEITMPEWKSTPGTRYGPSWEHRGVKFIKIAEEIGLLDRYGHKTTRDPNDERREKAAEAERLRMQRYWASVRAQLQLVVDELRAGEEEAKAAQAAQDAAIAQVANGTWGQTGTETATGGGTTTPTIGVVDPTPVAAPAEAKASAGAVAAAPQHDPTANGWGFPSTDPNNGEGPPDGHRIIISVPATPPLIAPPGGATLPHVSAIDLSPSGTVEAEPVVQAHHSSGTFS